MKINSNISFYPVSSSTIPNLNSEGILLEDYNELGINPAVIQMFGFKTTLKTFNHFPIYNYLEVDLNQNGNDEHSRHNAVMVEGSLSISSLTPFNPQLKSTYYINQYLLVNKNNHGTDSDWEQITPENTSNAPNWLTNLSVFYNNETRKATFKFHTDQHPPSFDTNNIIAKGIYTLI